jgi:hypothetical protein
MKSHLSGVCEIDCDELVLGGVEVGLKPEERTLVGDVLILCFPVVDQLHHLRRVRAEVS